MSLVRRVARPMLAAMFVMGGLDQLKHPGAKAKAAQPVLDQAAKIGLPDDPELLAVFEAWKTGDLSTSIPGGESGQEVLARYRGALEEISDQHRGETVLVFTHGGVMSFCLPRMGRNVRNDLAAKQFLPNCAVAEIAIDADDIVVNSWPGSADHSVV